MDPVFSLKWCMPGNLLFQLKVFKNLWIAMQDSWGNFFFLRSKIDLLIFFKHYRLVLDADNSPMVVPFVHTGMEEVMPIGAKFPRVGKTVCILVPLCFAAFAGTHRQILEIMNL